MKKLEICFKNTQTGRFFKNLRDLRQSPQKFEIFEKRQKAKRSEFTKKEKLVSSEVVSSVTRFISTFQGKKKNPFREKSQQITKTRLVKILFLGA